MPRFARRLLDPFRKRGGIGGVKSLDHHHHHHHYLRLAPNKHSEGNDGQKRTERDEEGNILARPSGSGDGTVCL
ncbi:hypothetical protein ZHAS_00014128 [Anopheles sinensis]|uniref:Uncharacterized protein n=1 Tax=Anopheles sinensis TaxID=74873 RepID=A0A084W7P6_ANOSI|nr:hypothetical protein ZHAS_00014128 [Anopheles sinensis]